MFGRNSRNDFDDEEEDDDIFDPNEFGDDPLAEASQRDEDQKTWNWMKNTQDEDNSNIFLKIK